MESPSQDYVVSDGDESLGLSGYISKINRNKPLESIQMDFSSPQTKRQVLSHIEVSSPELGHQEEFKSCSSVSVPTPQEDRMNNICSHASSQIELINP